MGAMKICLVQYSPFYPKAGMLDSYNEVVESYAWGFAALGHEVKRRINCTDPDSLNIVFGWQIPSQLGLMNTFPVNTIFFNFERYASHDRASPLFQAIASLTNQYQFWDYSLDNVEIVNAMNPKFPVYHARISYAPNLEKVPVGVKQDIDVLYYGKLPQYRFETLREISEAGRDLSGLSVMTLTNVWGKQRDEFIARAKVLVNISYGSIENFEIVRVSYLLANKKAVVCVSPDGHEKVESDLRDGGLKLVQTADARSACQSLVDDDAARERYAEQTYEVFRRRDVRDVITDFFV